MSAGVVEPVGSADDFLDTKPDAESFLSRPDDSAQPAGARLQTALNEPVPESVKAMIPPAPLPWDPPADAKQQANQAAHQEFTQIDNYFDSLKELAGGHPEKRAAIEQGRQAAYQDWQERTGMRAVQMQLEAPPVPRVQPGDLQTLGVPQTAAQFLAGAQNFGAGTADFLLSPGGAGAMVAQKGPAAVRRLASAYFAGKMLADTPELAKSLGEAVANKDWQKTTELGLNAVLTPFFVAETAKDALGIKAAVPGELTPQMAKANAEAVEALHPRNAQEFLDAAPPEKVGVTLGDYPQPGEAMPPELLKLRQIQPTELRPVPEPEPTPSEERPANPTEQPSPPVTGEQPIIAAPVESAAPVQTSGLEPVPVEEPAAPRKAGGSWVKWYPRADGIPDVLDAIHEEGGVASPKQSDFASKGDYDGYKEAFSQGMATRLRRSEGGAMPDELRDQLNTNHGFSFGSTSEMYDAIARAAGERKGLEERQAREERMLADEEAKTVNFEDLALKQHSQAEPVSAGTLAIGDKFKLKGEELTVTHYDPDTETYTVQGGRKFGSQQLHADAEFFPDKGSVKQVEAPAEFAPEDYEAAGQALQEQRVRMAMAQGGEPEVHAMSTSGAQPLRAGRTPPYSPGSPVPPAPRTSSRALPVPKVGPIRTWFRNLVRPVQNLMGPQSIDVHARTLANILRENGGKAALDLARADEAMKEFRSDFDHTPVPKGWKYDPAQPLPRNYDFLHKAERNRAGLSPEHQQLVSLFDQLFAQRIAEVRRLASGAMNKLIAEYFPHIWKDPVKSLEFTSSFLGKSPMHGDKSFLKQRSVPYILDGLRRGLEPVSDNPVDLLLIKMHQMDKFILAERTLQEAQQAGLKKYLPVGKRVPEGWAIYNDRSSTVNGPPVVTVKEAYDAGLRKGLMDFIAKMGFTHQRVANIDVNVWGQYTAGGKIESRFGGPDFVITHEIGHGLDEKYGLLKYLTTTPAMRQELMNLAKLRYAGQTPTADFKQYVLKPGELMANAVHAFVHAPDLMRQTAPRVMTAFQNFINAHPELADLNDIRPGLALDVSKTEIPLPGFTVLGHYIMPEGAVQVLNNYLSPGLGRFAAYRSLRAASNLMNAAQLGMSGFHLGFTSLDATVSSVAVGLQQLSTLDPATMAKGAKRIAGSPLAPVANYYVGKAVQEAMLRPGSNAVKILGIKYNLSPHGAAVADHIAQLAVTAGMRATVDPFYKTEFTRKLVRSFHQGGVEGYAGTALHLPMALVEQTMRPITEFLVPRQKLGVFAQMAMHAMDQLGPGATHDQVREALAKAADSTENRMGQMTYDNLFYNKVVKDVALLGFRAYGWQLGKYRESLGAVADTASQAKALLTEGKRPELTNRMAYVVALPMVVGAIGALTHYLMTGQRPQSATDYFFPQTGKLDKDGRPQRLMLPSYLKDLISDWHDFPSLAKMGASFYHKLNPLISTTVDLLRNKDFYGTEIRHEDDPFWKQQLDNVRYVLKSAQPFSITGMQKLKEEGAGPRDYVLPFFGIVPAKKALTMTPAEAKAADIIANSLPVGSRTQEQFDHSQLVKTLVRDLKQDPIKGMVGLQAAAAGGQLKPNDPGHIANMLALKPLQYQVQKMGPDDAMRVWDLANPQERALLKDMIMVKIGGSKVLDEDVRARYLAVLTGSRIPAGNR